MTQVVVMQRQPQDQSSVFVGSETKNSFPTNSQRFWEDFAGLSWLIIKDPQKYAMDAI